MRWRMNRGPKPRPCGAPPRRGLDEARRLDHARQLDGRPRLVLTAGVSAVLLVSVAGAASAGVFTGRGQASAGSTEHQRLAASAQPGTAQYRSAGRSAHAADRTSCTSVAHVGDSTSVGMVSRQSLPDPTQRLPAQYRDVGVRRVWIDASGGRAIVERLPGQRNGYRVATRWYQEGFRGCWVFALGTNDTANVSIGSPIGIAARIREMMYAAHGEPVMWVNTETGLRAGPWSQANMRAWNNALVAACTAYPNMRVFNWAAMVRPSWHLADGIHYTPAGYAVRARAIARALARAFPANGQSGRCVVL